jgi:murein L,D-transpeptidase YafK
MGDSLMKARRLAIFAGLFLAALSGIWFFARESGLWYRTVDRAQMAMRQINRKLHCGLGWQLPGTPDLAALDARLAEKNLKRGDAVFIRLFKSELRLELWMQQGERFVLFTTYPICYYSGQLGPKLRQGDRQSPEGFYTVGKGQLNPNSHWFRAFNVGFPNLLDQAQGRTGAHLMVHGGCSSIGCYAMTNPVIGEIWTLVTAALNNGQSSFGMHIFPFRLSEARLDAYDGNPWAPFWRELKPGYDLFEATHVPPQISICQKRYVAEPGAAGTKNSTLRSACPAGASNAAPGAG